MKEEEGIAIRSRLSYIMECIEDIENELKDLKRSVQELTESIGCKE